MELLILIGIDMQKEYGDYQTPLEFCQAVCKYIKKKALYIGKKAILEPTCGVGNFLYSASLEFGINKLYGVEINPEYAKISKQKNPNSYIINDSIFDINLKNICKEEPILIIGNPPWAMSSEIIYNLPQKSNFKKLKGLDALTGKSNFDICESIIFKLAKEFKNTDSLICMLCKTSVARNIISEISKNQIEYCDAEILTFNARKLFNISASSCILLFRLSRGTSNLSVTEKSFDDERVLKSYDLKLGEFQSRKINYDLDGCSQIVWRQGVKHDCSKVMELSRFSTSYTNKLSENVEIENDLVYPLVKSSSFKTPIISSFNKFVLVTQKKLNQSTDYIRNKFPKTWNYLESHKEMFISRKSSIYKNSPNYSMFGIGDYSYSPYKVGFSGFYKKPLFSLLESDKPVMTDDTCYFIPFDNRDIAYCFMLMLNSDITQEFIESIAFLDHKRPYTAKLLSRIDFKKCLNYINYDLLRKTEVKLSLPYFISEKMYALFCKYISSL